MSTDHGPKSATYVERIRPLLREVAEICHEQGIGFFGLVMLDRLRDVRTGEPTRILGRVIHASKDTDPDCQREIAAHFAVDQQNEIVSCWRDDRGEEHWVGPEEQH